jgi:hypothetical protein
VALRAILALPLRAMASLFCGRDGSKPLAGSNQSKDCRLLRGSGHSASNITRDEPRVSSLIVGANSIQDLRDCAPYSTLRTCWVRYF